MNRAVLLALALPAASAFAAGPSPTPSPLAASEIAAFAIRPPDENSPFFLDARAGQVAAQTSGPDLGPDEVAQFPRNRGSSKSAAAQIRSFFTDMFASVNFGPLRGAPVTSKLDVEPSAFSLEERRELNVTYTIRNNTKKIMRLEYPTTQRIEILTQDATGTVVDKWSDDRTFEDFEGIVVINPNERIEYQEKIPTREMKPGDTYTVDAFATTEPEFRTQEYVTPR